MRDGDGNRVVRIGLGDRDQNLDIFEGIDHTRRNPYEQAKQSHLYNSIRPVTDSVLKEVIFLAKRNQVNYAKPIQQELAAAEKKVLSEMQQSKSNNYDWSRNDPKKVSWMEDSIKESKISHSKGPQFDDEYKKYQTAANSRGNSLSNLRFKKKIDQSDWLNINKSLGRTGGSGHLQNSFAGVKQY